MFHEFLKNNPILGAVTGVFLQIMSFIIANHMAILGSLTAIGGFIIVIYTIRIKKREQIKIDLEIKELQHKEELRRAADRYFP